MRALAVLNVGIKIALVAAIVFMFARPAARAAGGTRWKDADKGAVSGRAQGDERPTPASGSRV